MLLRHSEPFYGFQTLLRGVDFPRSAVGALISSHARALNIAVSGNRLVSLVLQEADMTVSSLLVRPGSGAVRLDELPVSPDERVEIRERVIRFRHGCVINLGAPGQAIPYEGRIAELPAACRRRLTNEVPGPLTDAILTIGRGRGLAPLATLFHGDPAAGNTPENPGDAKGDPFVRAARAVLVPALENAMPLHALARLVGLGIGLTPSGDDFVAGALAARALVYGSEPLPAQITEAIAGRAAGTTIAGSTIIRDALGGCFPAYLQRFARDIARASDMPAAGAIPRRIRAAVSRAAEHGHSSGIDAVTGFAFGLTSSDTGGIVT